MNYGENEQRRAFIRGALQGLSLNGWCEEEVGDSMNGPFWIGKMSIGKQDAKDASGVLESDAVHWRELKGHWTMAEHTDGDFIAEKHESKKEMNKTFARAKASLEEDLEEESPGSSGERIGFGTVVVVFH